MWLEAIHKPACDEAKCPTCGGSVQDRVFGEMHAGSFVLNGERVEIRKRPDAQYRDPVVLDPLTQYFDGGLYRLWPKERYFSRGGKTLHRDAWVSAFGPIPRGCHIHHKDGNGANNALANLECWDSGEHLALTWRESSSRRVVHFTERARTEAAKWHASEAGRLWHKRHAEWTREKRPCARCGIIFDCLVRKSGRTQKFCSNNCKASVYRKRCRDARNR